MDKDEEKTIKVAALGDLHIGAAAAGRTYAGLFKEISNKADVLVLCGDLTNIGSPEEAARVAQDLHFCTIPVVGVLGNHDHESGIPNEIERMLIEAGLRPLEERTQVIEGVGFAGVKGFGGGFGRHTLGSFGESAVKSFVEETMRETIKLENALHRLVHLTRVVVVLHYSPITQTVEGEPLEIYPYLGSSRLEETIDRYDNVRAVFHGHAHRGTYNGKTGRGAPVYNCSETVLKDNNLPFALIEIPPNPAV